MLIAATETYGGSLSGDERERFEALGWLGPYPLLTAERVNALHKSFVDTGDIFSVTNLRKACERNDFDTYPWFKSLHAYLPEFFEVASQPAIVERLAPLLGPDIMAWGVSVTTRTPGQVHRWHVDVEHVKWPGISVFIGLKNTSRNSSLKVISGSHRFATVPQALGTLSDEEVLAIAHGYDSESRLETIDMNEGEFFIFHGKLWHGSHNTGKTVRTAVIAQYASPEAEVAIPMGWDEPISWHPQPPPCILVRGSNASGRNRVMNLATPGAGPYLVLPKPRRSLLAPLRRPARWLWHKRPW